MARNYYDNNWNTVEEEMFARIEDTQGLHDSEEAWDLDPFYEHTDEAYDLDLDDEDASGDWQVLANDRFGDRLVNGMY